MPLCKGQLYFGKPLILSTKRTIPLGKKVGVITVLVVEQIEIGELLVWLKHTGQPEGPDKMWLYGGCRGCRWYCLIRIRVIVTGLDSFLLLRLVSRQTSDIARYVISAFALTSGGRER